MLPYTIRFTERDQSGITFEGTYNNMPDALIQYYMLADSGKSDHSVFVWGNYNGIDVWKEYHADDSK